MREKDLADLLIQLAADRGVDTESAAEELATTALPSFVDARAFRGAVVQALEAQMRAQMEQRLQSIRQRFDVDASQQVAPPPRRIEERPIEPIRREPERQAPAVNAAPDFADATMTDLTPPAAEEVSTETDMVEDEMPSDATMVWTTRHG